MGDTDKYNILVVDDDVTVTDLVCETLGDDYNMFVALVGAEAMVLATQDTLPDLIILDINLPGKDGHMVAEQLSQNESAKGIPIIFITGLRDDDEVVKSYQVGGNDLIFKPINVRILKEKVKAHLNSYIERRELSQRAITDPVTHLHNSRGFNIHYKNLWLTAKVLKQSITLAFVSLDNIEDIPRYCGIINREDLLKTFARKLSYVFESVHCEIACYSGHVFAVVALDQSTHQIETLMTSLFTHVSHMQGEKQTQQLAMSVGIASGEKGEMANSEMLKITADKAWLQARQKNKLQPGFVVHCL